MHWRILPYPKILLTWLYTSTSQYFNLSLLSLPTWCDHTMFTMNQGRWEPEWTKHCQTAMKTSISTSRVWAPGEGVLTFKGHMGMSRPNGSFCHKTALDMGMLSRKRKPLDMGLFFQNVQNFGCFGGVYHPKCLKCEKLAYIFRNILRNGYLFRQKNYH